MHHNFHFFQNKTQYNTFYFNQPWYFIFFCLETKLAATATDAIAVAVAAVAAVLIVMYFGQSILINPFRLI